MQLSGFITALSGIAPTSYRIADSEGAVQPSRSIAIHPDGSYQATIPLVASRGGTDTSGRTYTIIVTATDYAGNANSTSASVLVPHDQGH